MPVPTPPKVNPLNTQPTPVVKKAGKKPSPRVPGRPSKSTQKLSAEVRELTETLDENSVDIPQEKKPVVKKKTPFKPAEHLTQSPFRDNEAMRELQRELKNPGEN